jgi:hypothetical protein
MFTKKFVNAYKKELNNEYRHFYDDIDEYGNKESELAIYFIEGINGVPGQIRFTFPSLFKKFGRDFYVKCLYLKEFSSKSKLWDKYTLTNLEKKRKQILSDLSTLTSNHKKIIIVCSSNGFYDFLYAYQTLPESIIEKSSLVWVSVAPDHFLPSKWGDRFYRYNGFKQNGHKWFAFPNSNLLKFMNPEVTYTHKWDYKNRKKTFFKHDLELRFKCFGLNWAYASIDCFNSMLTKIRSNVKEKIKMPTYILAATNDGYWQGKPKSDIKAQIDKYIVNKKIIYKNSSHLWVLTPDNVTELLNLIE